MSICINSKNYKVRAVIDGSSIKLYIKNTEDNTLTVALLDSLKRVYCDRDLQLLAQEYIDDLECNLQCIDEERYTRIY